MFSTSTKVDEAGPQLTHIDSSGQASMVDVGGKKTTERSATAVGRVYIPERVYQLITDSSVQRDNVQEKKATKKGDVLAVAQLAGIIGAKKTSDLIPLCHPLALSHVSVLVEAHPELRSEEGESSKKWFVLITATAKCQGSTGVEMEALTAVSIAALTVWDMLKAVGGREMVISDIIVAKKAGGRSGDFVREL